jgi:hypothetical protein
METNQISSNWCTDYKKDTIPTSTLLFEHWNKYHGYNFTQFDKKVSELINYSKYEKLNISNKKYNSKE